MVRGRRQGDFGARPERRDKVVRDGWLPQPLGYVRPGFNVPEDLSVITLARDLRALSTIV